MSWQYEPVGDDSSTASHQQRHRQSTGVTAVTPLNLDKIPTATLKIIVLGDAGVGKTTLCQSLVTADDEPEETEEEGRSPRATQTFANASLSSDIMAYTLDTAEYGLVRINLWDSAGEEFTEGTSNVFRDANGIILMYDVTSYRSFQSIRERWMPRVRSLLGEGGTTDDVLDERALMERDNIFKLLVVANKVDLAADKRVVSEAECVALTNRLKLPYVQLSSIDTKTAKLPFILLTKMLVPAFMSIGPQSVSSQRLALDDPRHTTTTGTESTTCC